MPKRFHLYDYSNTTLKSIKYWDKTTTGTGGNFDPPAGEGVCVDSNVSFIRAAQWNTATSWIPSSDALTASLVDFYAGLKFAQNQGILLLAIMATLSTPHSLPGAEDDGDGASNPAMICSDPIEC